MTDDTLSRTPEDIQTSTEKLLRDLKAVVQDGEELLRAGAQDLGERGVAARERLSAALDVARQTRSQLETRVRTTATSADRSIREHPYQSIGTAFGIGVVLGLLVNRR
jgi:ElaB/YqjD/DUF883 family membrane-anchored ribosome-binding protein